MKRQAARLRLQVIENKAASQEPPGTVLSQDPWAGSSVEGSDILYLVVAAPKSQVQDDDLSLEDQPPEEVDQPGEAPSKFTGVHADNYETAYAICESFGLREVAKEFNTAQDPVAAAEGYASQYQPAFQQAPFEGCFDGLTAG